MVYAPFSQSHPSDGFLDFQGCLLYTSFFVNQIDREHADFEKIYMQLHEKYGTSVMPVMIPIMDNGKVVGYVDVIKKKAMYAQGKGYKAEDVPAELVDFTELCNIAVVEAAAESDDELMEKYFSGETLSEQELIAGLHWSIAAGRVAPMLAGSALQNLLIDAAMDKLSALMPSPLDLPGMRVENSKTGELVAVNCDPKEPFAAQVVKTVADPFVGKLSILRVYAGELKNGMTVYNTRSEKQEKIGTVYIMNGKKQNDVDVYKRQNHGRPAEYQLGATLVCMGNSLCDHDPNRR